MRQSLEVVLFAMTPAIDIAWENQPYTVVVGTPFVRAALIPDSVENPEITGHFHRLVGLFYLEFNYPKNTGSVTAATRAELTKQTFKFRSSFVNSGVTTTISGTPEIGRGSNVGDWWILPMRMPWYANILS